MHSSQNHHVLGVFAVVAVLLFSACDTVETERAFDVEGRVILGSAGLSGVTLDLSGEAERSTSTDATGVFRFPDLPAGRSYLVTPSSADFTFEPAEVRIDNLSGDRTLSFSATPIDEIVGGVNLSRLFEGPSSAEIAAVAAEWDGRTVQSAGYRVEHEEAVDGGLVRIISHVVDGLRHVALVRVPDAGRDLPVIVINHGGESGIDADEYLAYSALFGELLDRAIFVMPAFRSESIRAGGNAFTAEGEPSMWDRDVDDALAAMQVVMENEPRARTDRAATIGFSRGGGVSLLMGVRDPRIQAVVGFFGPTHFFDEYVRHVARTILATGQFFVPGSRYLFGAVLDPLRSGHMSLADARIEMVRRSPALYAERLPAVQIHHGTHDFVVWASQAERLDEALRAAGRTSPSATYEFYLYEGAGHTPAELIGSFTRTTGFLVRHLDDD